MTYASNEELAAGLAASDEQAFQQFARIYGPRLRAYYLARGMTMGDADSLSVSMVTDISLKATQFHVERGGNFDAWVFTLARHGLADWWRLHPPITQFPQDLPAPQEDPPNTDLVEGVRGAMSKLTPVDREILRRRDMGYMESYQEIAEEVGLQPGTARVRRMRALRRLEKELRGDPRIARFLTRWEKEAGSEHHERSP